MSGFCRDCKHARDSGIERWTLECQKAESKIMDPLDPETKAFAYSNSEDAILYVEPDFGCVQFEKK